MVVEKIMIKNINIIGDNTLKCNAPNKSKFNKHLKALVMPHPGHGILKKNLIGHT
jgi:hypothetical protein